MIPEVIVIVIGLFTAMAAIVGYTAYENAMHDSETPRIAPPSNLEKQLEEEREEERQHNERMINLITLGTMAITLSMLPRFVMISHTKGELAFRLITAVFMVILTRIYFRVTLYPKEPHDHYL